MPNIEKERKFLVELPLKWFAKFKAATADKVVIRQTYLDEPGKECSHVNSVLHFGIDFPKCSFTYTEKKLVSSGVNIQSERALTQEEFSAMLHKFVDVDKNRITKTRYMIDFDSKLFHFDLFDDQLLGLAILEVSVDDMLNHIMIPPYFKLTEITGDTFYSTSNLASLDSYKSHLLRFGGLDTRPNMHFPRRID